MKNWKVALATASACVSMIAFGNGTVAGTVSFQGTPPKMESLKVGADPVCAKNPAKDESILVNKNGKGLANVVVRIKDAPATPPPSTPVVIDQKGCTYRPRVQVAVEGQKVEVRNDDNTLHNVHSFTQGRTLFNQAQPPQGRPIEKSVTGVDVLKLKCDVHPWMTGYVAYSKNAYSAVTDPEGKFEIKNVPPGGYTVEAWQEKLGTQTAHVKVEDGKTAAPKFTFGNK